MTYFSGFSNILGMSNQTLPSTSLGQSNYGLVKQGSIGPLIDSAKALLIVSSFGIGLLSGKVSSLTAKDTVKLAIVMGVTVIALLMGDMITKIFISNHYTDYICQIITWLRSPPHSQRLDPHTHYPASI